MNQYGYAVDTLGKAYKDLEEQMAKLNKELEEIEQRSEKYNEIAVKQKEELDKSKNDKYTSYLESLRKYLKK